MPFKTSDELKQFLKSIVWSCTECLYETTVETEFDRHTLIHQAQKEIIKQKGSKKPKKSIPELKNMLEDV